MHVFAGEFDPPHELGAAVETSQLDGEVVVQLVVVSYLSSRARNGRPTEDRTRVGATILILHTLFATTKQIGASAGDTESTQN